MSLFVCTSYLGIAGVTQNKTILSRSLVYTWVLLYKIIFTGPRNEKTDTVCVVDYYFKVCCLFLLLLLLTIKDVFD